ncbi:Flp pilus assembly protein ATPase CpaE-like protein [Nitrosococcus halophilus Nc 4]|uniref:Flp pilus assembly protein ATPase CpaE-like protein n=1 Tax=Nitrosococcus halophilus (strain Nc4) TaxID=472759 RepID=D5C119_NITHN|nr:AAA family ATPase [Nitrosococcus halophilus]ADE14576.1 Flp pilus assembly protein ATPase CpaE-like protein [Nitrosococcus halophilus Nc 4]
MKNKPMILVAGRDKQHLQAMGRLFCDPSELQVRIHHMENGHTDPLYGITVQPDILVLVLSAAWEEELRALRTRAASQGLPMIAIGPAGNTQVMRRAMQAGARDFFTHPAPPEELLASTLQIVKDLHSPAVTGQGVLTAVINGTNGSGATFLACNIAHMMTVHSGIKVALMDMDLQFGNLPLYLDMNIRNSLSEVFAAVDQLDGVALEGYMGKHPSGLHLLASASEQVLLPWEISEKDLNRLLDISLQTYEHVVVDLPRQIDSLTSTVLERAHHVIIVMQESLTSIRDAKRLLQIVQRDLAVLDENIYVVVNRHQDKNAISLADLRDALKISSFLLIPNDFKRVMQSINTGVPLFESEKNAAITKAVLEVAVKLSGKPQTQSQNILRRALSYFLPH